MHLNKFFLSLLLIITFLNGCVVLLEDSDLRYISTHKYNCKPKIISVTNTLLNIYGTIETTNCAHQDQYFYLAKNYCKRYGLHAIYLHNDKGALYEKTFADFQCIRLMDYPYY